MKKTLLTLALGLAASFAVSESLPSSTPLLAPEYKEGAFKWLNFQVNDSTVTAIRANLLKAAETMPQPQRKIIVPASQNEPAVTLYVYDPKDARPEEALPVIYFTHGGGYVVGNARQNSDELSEIANQHRVRVVSVEYRLATQAPFPAALNDAYRGLDYVFTHRKALGSNGQVILMGESAGGGLAARLAIYTRDQGKHPLAGQVLIYPMLDYRTGTAESPYQQPYAGQFVWTAEANRYGWNKLRGGQTLEGKQLGYFSPAMADNLSQPPPTFMVVGDLDLFANEDINYANRLIQAGVPTELHTIAGAVHIFETLNSDASQTKLYQQLRGQAIDNMLKRTQGL